MNSLTSVSGTQPPWIRRLLLPAYQVKDAARYANISPQTILNWQKKQAGTVATISTRDQGQALSYLQLIELAVVASMRSAGVSLSAIRAAKLYVAQRLRSEFPFAAYDFKTDGTNILTNLSTFVKGESPDKLISVSRGGQLAWQPILERRLKEFEYQKGLAVKWNLDAAISIDPQIAFGAPSIKGIPTWTIKGRLDAGESIEDIAYDFSLKVGDVENALKFEGIDKATIANAEWNH